MKRNLCTPFSHLFVHRFFCLVASDVLTIEQFLKKVFTFNVVDSRSLYLKIYLMLMYLWSNFDNWVTASTNNYLVVLTIIFFYLQSVSYRATSRTLQRTLFWKNIKMYVIIALVVALAIYLIGAMACGGLAWRSCVG